MPQVRAPTRPHPEAANLPPFNETAFAAAKQVSIEQSAGVCPGSGSYHSWGASASAATSIHESLLQHMQMLLNVIVAHKPAAVGWA